MLCQFDPLEHFVVRRISCSAEKSIFLPIMTLHLQRQPDMYIPYLQFKLPVLCWVSWVLELFGILLLWAVLSFSRLRHKSNWLWNQTSLQKRGAQLISNELHILGFTTTIAHEQSAHAPDSLNNFQTCNCRIKVVAKLFRIWNDKYLCRMVEWLGNVKELLDSFNIPVIWSYCSRVMGTYPCNEIIPLMTLRLDFILKRPRRLFAFLTFSSAEENEIFLHVARKHFSKTPVSFPAARHHILPFEPNLSHRTVYYHLENVQCQSWSSMCSSRYVLYGFQSKLRFHSKQFLGFYKTIFQHELFENVLYTLLLLEIVADQTHHSFKHLAKQDHHS